MLKLPLPPLRQDEYRISVVLPVYAETDSIPPIVEGLTQMLGARLHEIIVIVSPRSGVETLRVCDTLRQQFPVVHVHVQQVNPGLGNAVRQGYALARGNLVLNMDSDGEMELATVSRMVRAMEESGADLVLASRWLDGGGFQGYQRMKKILNFGFQMAFRILYRTPMHDLTYGFKLLRGEIARGIAWEGTLHEIACETTLKPIRAGARTVEVPSRWTARTQGVSKNPMRRNLRYVRVALKTLVLGYQNAHLEGPGRDRLRPAPARQQER